MAELAVRCGEVERHGEERCVALVDRVREQESDRCHQERERLGELLRQRPAECAHDEV